MQAIARSRSWEQRAQEAATFLRQVLHYLQEQDVYLDMQNVAEPVLLRACDRYGLRLTTPTGRKQAAGYVLLTVNLALEKATEGNVAKAAAALQKNDLAKIFVLGERLLDEARADVDTVLQRNLMHVKLGPQRYIWIELMPAALRDRLTRWSEVGLLMPDGLPPADRAQLEACKAELAYAELMVSTGRKVHWANVLNHTQAEFVRAYFARAKRNVPAVTGLWEPLVRSMCLNAYHVEHWSQVGRRTASVYTSVDQRVLVSPETAKRFLEALMFDPEDLMKRSTEIVFRVAQTFRAQQEGTYVFKEPCSDEEVDQVARRIGVLIHQLFQETRTFYMKHVRDVDAVADDELDRFWCTRLLLTSFAPAEVRLGRTAAQTKEPWKLLGQSMSLPEVAELFQGVADWPEDVRQTLVGGIWMRCLYDRNLGTEEVKVMDRLVSGLLKVSEAFAQACLAAVSWSKVSSNLIQELLRDSRMPGACLAIMVSAQPKSRWPTLMTAVIKGLRAEALASLSAEWRWEDWYKGMYYASSESQIALLWNQFGPEWPLYAMVCEPSPLGRFLVQQPVPAVERAAQAAYDWGREEGKESSVRHAWMVVGGSGFTVIDVLGYSAKHKALASRIEERFNRKET